MRAYENFEAIAREFYPERRGLPVLTATTLMVPGNVDTEEVGAIARFIADLDPGSTWGTSTSSGSGAWRSSPRGLADPGRGNLLPTGLALSRMRCVRCR